MSEPIQPDPTDAPATESPSSVAGAPSQPLGPEAVALAEERLFGEAPAWCAESVVDALQEHVAGLLRAAGEEGRHDALWDANPSMAPPVALSSCTWCAGNGEVLVVPVQWGTPLPASGRRSKCLCVLLKTGEFE